MFDRIVWHGALNSSASTLFFPFLHTSCSSSPFLSPFRLAHLPSSVAQHLEIGVAAPPLSSSTSSSSRGSARWRRIRRPRPSPAWDPPPLAPQRPDPTSPPPHTADRSGRDRLRRRRPSPTRRTAWFTPACGGAAARTAWSTGSDAWRSTGASLICCNI